MANKKISLISKDQFQAVVSKTTEEWQDDLSDESFHILREKGTERPFTGKFDHHFEPGHYICAGCGTPLFVSAAKFDSGCGWPSFDAPSEDKNITYLEDKSHGMKRIEIVCTQCGGHLGHVFDDGPTETGLRYCVNSASLDFKEK